MKRAPHTFAPDLQCTIDELKAIAPQGSNAQELLAGLVDVIDRHLKPLPDRQEHEARTATIIGRYCKTLERRAPMKRPKTRPGVFRSVSAFVTRDLRSAVREFTAFEAKAENAIVDNPVMILTSAGVGRHQERALKMLDRFMLIIAQQWENLGNFKTKLHQLEGQYYDRDDWSLHLHDRLNRLANLLTTVDSSVTAIKRALISDKPHEGAVDALRALRDNSLNPLEFIDKVFANNENACTIAVHPPQPPLTYSNHYMVREVLLELVHNALDARASTITLTARPTSDGIARIDIVDDCPGGIPDPIRTRIGKERIIKPQISVEDVDPFREQPATNGWGLYTVTNTLIPRLGSRASISFQSPITADGGTRVTLTVPIIDKATFHAPTPAARTPRKKTARALVQLCTDPFATGGTALMSNRMIARITLPD